MKNKQPLFYKDVVPLSVERHSETRIDTGVGYGFAREAISVLLTAVEFPRAALEYPLVFLEDGESMHPVALLGLPGGKNSFVRDGGRWDANYIPAYVRRYPFVTGTLGGKEDLALCIDESAPLVSKESGEPLFDEGKPTAFLQGCIKLVQDYQGQLARTREFSEQLKKLKLLKPMKADLSVGDGGTTVTGFHLVDRVRLKALRSKQLSSLAKHDDLDLIYAHLLSLSNFSKLAPAQPLQQQEKAS